MGRFRKKPVEIEAVRWDGWETVTLCQGEARLAHGAVLEHDYRHPHLAVIETLEGLMRVSPGDWIIKGVQGEFYPCKPDIFAATYEPAEASDAD